MTRSSKLPAKAQDKKADTRQLVTLVGSTPLATSLVVAEHFGKDHKNVMRSIRKFFEIEASTGLKIEPSNERKIASVDGSILSRPKSWAERNFSLSEYTDATGRTLPMYAMTKAGFALLVSKMTGDAAYFWTTRFIDEFERLEKIVQRVQQLSLEPEWNEARKSGKSVRRELTDVIQDHLIPYAKANGSTNYNRFYVNYSNMLISGMFNIEEQPGKSLRDCLNEKQLILVAVAESRMAELIVILIDEMKSYKEIYQDCKAWVVDQFVPAMGGKTKVVSTSLVTV